MHTIQTQELFHQYKAGKSIQFPNIVTDWENPLLILGPSGKGKTTLLHILAGILKPSKGSVIIDGVDIHSLDATALDAFRGQHIGMIFQRPNYIKAISVFENLALVRHFSQQNISNAEIHGLLDTLGILALKDKKPFQLSQGEQQRFMIARALVHKPSVVLADEPTSALDDDNTQIVAELIIQQCKANQACLLVVTHDIRLKTLFNNQIILQ